jgi:hypothetical protein
LAYARGPQKTVAFTPASLGLRTRAYVFDYFSRQGKILDPDETFTDSLENSYVYFIVVPLGRSGIAFLGDRDQFVSLGKQRISQLSDNGKVQVTIQFAPGEHSRTVQGYSPTAPAIAPIKGKIGAPMYDSAAHLFTVSVLPDSSGTAELEIMVAPR